jgi:DNA-binding TFAR19-related protein (PDSD5 family)
MTLEKVITDISKDVKTLKDTSVSSTSIEVFDMIKIPAHMQIELIDTLLEPTVEDRLARVGISRVGFCQAAEEQIK